MAITKNGKSESNIAPVPRLNVSVDEAAGALGIGRTKFYEKLREEGSKLRAIKDGRRTLIVWASVLAYQESLLKQKKAENDNADRGTDGGELRGDDSDRSAVIRKFPQKQAQK